MGRRNKWSIELIQQYLDENFNGYNVNGEYLNDKSKLLFICPFEHSEERLWYQFLGAKNKCNQCRRKLEDEKRNLEIKNIVEENEYTFIKIVDKNRMLVQCEKEHNPYEVSFNNFKRGKRCNKCATERASEQFRHSYDYVKEYVESFKLELISESYNGAHDYLLIKCTCNHPYKIRFNNFKKGHRCPKCVGKYRYPYDELKDIIANYGYKLLTPKEDYKSVAIPLDVQCPNGHITSKTKHALDNGAMCKYCYYDKLAISDALENNYTDISAYLRKFVSSWRKDVLEKYDYKCDISKSTDNIEVHHLVQFSRLVRLVFQNTKIQTKERFEDYSEKELLTLKDEIKRVHTVEIGIPLSKEIHDLFHDIYGRYNTNIEQYEEFKIKYLRGEYNAEVYNAVR